MTKKCLIYGASGHGKVVADLILKGTEYQLMGFYDDNKALQGKPFYNYPVFSDIAIYKDVYVIVAIGDNHTRQTIYMNLNRQRYCFVKAIHPKSILADNVSVDTGTVIMAGVVINSGTNILQNSIINTSSSIDHDCLIEDHCHIAPGVTICGGCKLGASTLIGAGSTITPNVKIGKNVVVGAGSVVVNNISDNSKVIGIPAREI